ncbi:hypothetical protein [Microbacterium capsulatum]|uniref:Uncharacterized protein n=1 Tax=Microbacterium capsulatum TaxID=3041921 RepID=A0ABU0XES1_9MICO|nr:hypothetical protein [Microbacterium sp. ASV81]MDQ4213617.1 hypothetical protein [Microbacterium sp. ASV81]
MFDSTTPSGDAGTRRRTLGRRYAGLLTAGAIALGTVGGLVAIPAAADAATVSAKAPAVCARDLTGLRHAYDKLPAALHTDIANARKDSTKSARQDAVKQILAKAQSGAYGADFAAAAKDRKTLEGAVDAWRRLPSALRDDVKSARAATGAARIQDLRSIVSKAESGGYGSRVEAAAATMKTRIERCEASVAGS